MSLRLVRAKKEDIPQLVDLYFNTFKSPLVLRAKPNIPQVREWYTKNLESDIEKPHMRIYKLVENQPESGSESIIAFGKWSSPHKESPEEKAFEYPEGAEPALWEEVIGKVTEKKKQIMGDEEFWCKLSSICIVWCNSANYLIRLERHGDLATAPAQGGGILHNDRVLQTGG